MDALVIKFNIIEFISIMDALMLLAVNLQLNSAQTSAHFHIQRTKQYSS